MKVKCISNISSDGYVSDYLTIGKIYRMLPYDYENDSGNIIDDDGDAIFEYLVEPAHGQWEVVE